MQKADPLIRTKLHPPFTRTEQVSRPRLQEKIALGLRGPLTLITAPAGFGKTTLVASCLTGSGLPVAWLSLDKNDNQTGRFLSYLIAALQEADPTIGSEAAQLLEALQQAPSETILTSLINYLDIAHKEINLVLDDYQFINSQAVHESVAFLLEHCPSTLHLVIASRSDPPLPLARLRARGQTVELRTADLRFTEPEAEQFLNDVMGLHLDAGSVAALAGRTEGWIAGLQMAALSMRDRENVLGFIENFSGTNRYILDYLIEEVLASQPPEIQHFLLFTSILERLTAPLCEAVLEVEKLEGWNANKFTSTLQKYNPPSCQQILEYLERTNLFLVPLDDERIWYRYHHLFTDLLRTQLQRSLPEKNITQLHVHASDWYKQNGLILDAIHHASMASDDERVERFIEQHYMELVNHGEMLGYRFWTGKLSKKIVHRRPWLCIYEAYSHSWFGELDEADRLIEAAEKHIQHEKSSPETHSLQAHLAYIKSRVTAMRGDIHRAIELCLEAREYTPTGNLALQFDTLITLGYEYFLSGDYANASHLLNDAIRISINKSATIYIVAASCILARLSAHQGLLKKSLDTYKIAAQSIPEASGEHRDARALVEVGFADVLYEWNDLEAALVHVKQGMALLPFWGKIDDSVLAYITLARIHLAQANRGNAIEAVERALQLIQTRGVFLEIRNVVEAAQVKLWLVQGDQSAVDRWIATHDERFGLPDRFQYEDELTHITQARVLIAQKKLDKAIRLLSGLEESARSGGRQGRLIEIMILKALALQKLGEPTQALAILTESLALAEPEGYIRIFVDEGSLMQTLLAQWLAHASAGPMRDYAIELLSHFDAEPQIVTEVQKKAHPTGDLVEPLSQRELEVLHLLALGKTNQEIAQQLIVATGTVKAHAASIYRKLDVANRTEAVARARQLAILP